MSAMMESEHYPEMRTPAQKRLDDIEKGQRQMNDLLEILPITVKMGDDAVVSWLAEFAPLTVCPIIKTDNAAVLNELKAAGYKSDDAKKDEAEATSSRKAFARHIVGQAMNSLEKSGHLDSPMTEHEVARFFKMGHEQTPSDWVTSVNEKVASSKSQGRF